MLKNYLQGGLDMSRWIQDAGHGGSDPGAVCYGQAEKDWALEAALYVNKRLKELRISSSITRNTDVSLSRQERTSKVKKYDKCISHHFNAGGGAGTEFIHSIYANGRFEKLLSNEFDKAGYRVRRTYTRRYPNQKDRDYYYMHRETGSCRTTIVEYDFLDGANRQKLKNKDYRVGMYECVVKAICREEGVTYNLRKNGISHSESLYCVIAGSFKNMDNAKKRVKELKGAGFTAFIERNES